MVRTDDEVVAVVVLVPFLFSIIILTWSGFGYGFAAYSERCVVARTQGRIHMDTLFPRYPPFTE
jgi:hypothetical protein